MLSTVPKGTLLFTLAVRLLWVGATPTPRHTANYVESRDVSGSYDFIVVGGGLAGLVVASRLSDDPNTSVLVIEAGDTGDAVKDRITVPGNAYYNGLMGSDYDWNFSTAPQAGGAGRNISWPRGKILGGSSAINGMYLVYPSENDINAWRDLIAPNDAAAADVWGWDKFSASMKRAETFTPPIDSVKSQDSIQFVASSRGTSGPLQATYPAYGFSVIGDFVSSLNAVGVPPYPDEASGQSAGSFTATSAINPANWTRSYSKSAYIDPLPPRSNLAILVNQRVTQIEFSKDSSGNLTATGIQYASAPGAAAQTVKANKEVILSGGAIGSPQLLLASGVGPKDVLQAAGIAVQLELPGVGQHLQDHMSLALTWNTSYQTAGAMYASKAPDTSTPQFMSYINSATSYANLTRLLGDGLSSFISGVNDAMNSSASGVPSTDPTVLAGWQARYKTVTNILNSPSGAIEMILNLAAPGSIGIIVSLQHPLSQGRLYVTSPSVFDNPVIDPNYFSHPADKTMFREGLKLARTVGGAQPLSNSLQGEIAPGSAIQSDADWDNYYPGQISTEFHPSGSCSMLPLSQGGVVDANLVVYGTTNLRVVDASVFPISMAAHLMTPTYGLSEQAVDIIRAKYNPPASGTNSTAPPSQTTGTRGGSIHSFPIPSSVQLLLCAFIPFFTMF